MRIPSDKPIYTEPPKAREKTAVEGQIRAPEATSAVPAPKTGDAAVPSASLDQAVQDTDMAAREFEKTISARLDEVRQQLLAGNYAVDFERLAQRMLEDGFGS